MAPIDRLYLYTTLYWANIVSIAVCLQVIERSVILWPWKVG